MGFPAPSKANGTPADVHISLGCAYLHIRFLGQRHGHSHCFAESIDAGIKYVLDPLRTLFHPRKKCFELKSTVQDLQQQA
jgi:hypothetical protein